MLDSHGLVLSMVHPEKAPLEALEPGLSPGSGWCSALWPTAELWPLQQCSQHTWQVQPQHILREVLVQGLGLPWCPPLAAPLLTGAVEGALAARPCPDGSL